MDEKADRNLKILNIAAKMRSSTTGGSLVRAKPALLNMRSNSAKV